MLLGEGERERERCSSSLRLARTFSVGCYPLSFQLSFLCYCCCFLALALAFAFDFAWLLFPQSLLGWSNIVFLRSSCITEAAMVPEAAAYENMVVDDGDVRKIVLDYLIHNCLKETAEAFVSCTGMKCTLDWSIELESRKTIYTHAMEGNIMKALELTNELAADLLQNNQDVLFDLLTLHFVELVRCKNCTGAVEFAQRELTPYGKLDRYIEKLQDFMTLLAYEDPEKSPVYELLSMDHRLNVAEKLNRIVLAHYKLPNITSLERLLQQVIVVRCCLSQDGGKDGGAPFSLTSFLKR